jgi:alpha-glucoside transport system substrate-binding protein
MRVPIPVRTLVAVGAATMLTTACLSSGSSGGGGGGGTGSAAADDKKVTIWTSVDQPVMDGLKAAMEPLAKAKGVTVEWTKVNDINQLIMTKIQAGQTPDIALVPQPGVVAQIVSRGKAVDLSTVLNLDSLKTSMVAGALDAGTVNGKVYSLLASMNVKSLVFYNKKAWDAKGYQAPKSLAELEALTDKIKADGGVPWCMGIASKGSNGWPATDWIEELVMKQSGAQTYNDWVSHKVKFDGPEVRKATDEFSKLLFTKGNTLGGQGAIASTDFGVAGNPMFDKAGPKCWLYKQGSFITGKDFLGKNVTDPDTEIGVFAFPPATAGGDNPVEGGGDLAVLMNSKQSAKDVMNILATPDVGVDAAKNTSYLSPFKTFPLTNYPSKLTQGMAKVAYDATAFLFDGSDAMPAVVGTGSFWKEMTSWVAGQESVDDALKKIDASWPAS